MTQRMLKRFLSFTGLASLSELHWEMLVQIWREARAVRDKLSVMSGATRDWKNLCPVELFDANWATEWPVPEGQPIADRRDVFPPRHSAVPWDTASRRLGLVVMYEHNPFWHKVLANAFAKFPAGAVPAKEPISRRAAVLPGPPLIQAAVGGALAPALQAPTCP